MGLGILRTHKTNAWHEKWKKKKATPHAPLLDLQMALNINTYYIIFVKNFKKYNSIKIIHYIFN